MFSYEHTEGNFNQMEFYSLASYFFNQRGYSLCAAGLKPDLRVARHTIKLNDKRQFIKT